MGRPYMLRELFPRSESRVNDDEKVDDDSNEVEEVMPGKKPARN